MFNQVFAFITGFFTNLFSCKPQRVLRQLTSKKNMEQVATVAPVVTMQVLNQNLHRTASFSTVGRYIRDKFPSLKDVEMSELGVLWGELPSLVPKEERFAVMYLVHDHCVFDSGLVACAFHGIGQVQLVQRSEVVYGPDQDTDRSRKQWQQDHPNHCSEVAQPTNSGDDWNPCCISL